MNKYYLTKFTTRLSIFLAFIVAIVIINSCKKDNAIDNQSNVDPLTLKAAKEWYEAKYPKSNTNGLTMHSTTADNIADFSQLVNPNWLRANGYERFDKQILEIPVTDSSKLLARMNLGIVYADPKLSRSSFLIVNDNGKYTAFVMMIIADSAYVKNDLSKLAKNTYNKHEADFSGEVFYFSPKGKLLSGYLYKDGAVKKQFSMGTSSSQQKIQSINSAPVKVLGCTHWFADVYVGGTFVETLDLGIACDNEPVPPILMEDGAEGFPQPPYGYDVGGGGGGGASSATDILDDRITNDETFLLDCDSIALLKLAAYKSYGSMYQQVAGFIPSQAVLSRLDSINGTLGSMQFTTFSLQSISNASGPIVNSDFYPIHISTLPSGMTMASLTEFYRLNLNLFTDGLANFYPYADNHIDDTQRFNSSGIGSVGALVHINMKDDGTVIESDYKSDASGTYYKFSTMTSPLDFNHPVSGNREFGIYPDPNNPGTYTFYTMGVDRTSDWMFATVNSFNTVFDGADKLWTKMQNKLIEYVNQHGGQAGMYVKPKYIARPDYDVVKDYLNGNITLDSLKRKIGC